VCAICAQSKTTKLYSSDDLAGTQATGTCVDTAGSSADDSPDALDVGLEGSVGTPVGVRNLNAERYRFAADVTLSHNVHLLFYINRDMIADSRDKSKHYFIFLFSLFLVLQLWKILSIITWWLQKFFGFDKSVQEVF